MTINEKVIRTAYTGKNLCVGEEFRVFKKYAEKVLNRHISPQEFSTTDFWDELQYSAEDDYNRLIAGEEVNI